ncbi:halocarboxylic acid dehydrogenase DehI family protein [Natrinema sp. 1APR25-10V2]|uniref:halocarboxylic acid dehydrogenase DehI family protein n=1 Tax=Natrinema sp. 1APR25-10V2 TaxID=2951081 RepID=UPI0028764B7D|nr:halocarboxylic acid dehydrogenase DehI family protein [Natrinema sp. 1APR25-10V2]MDS0475463.1 halocarboxylic acid dehydrogenase DehI family protein [Natrinema sp. 1APR25-10V2]
MDRSKQLYEQDATGWQRGLYEDIKTTFRAPIVNWYFRSLTANEPAFARYMWGQIKPLFQTREFGRYSVGYRDAVLSAIEGGPTDLPRYRRADTDLRPAEWRELRGQIATFDIVAPRLALTFAVCDRAINDELPDADPDGAPSTVPLPAWLDRDRGRSVTMLEVGDVPDDLSETVADIREFHGFESGLPSIYRCLAQWPGYLEPAWADLEPVLESEAFERGCHDADAVVDDHLERLPYTPRLSPADLAEQGFDDETIDELQHYVRAFNRGATGMVLQTIVTYAATLDAGGERSL